METLITISNFLIFGLIIISPVVLLIILKRKKTKHPLIMYSLISLLVLGLLILLFAWWAEKSDMILLEHFGYNDDGWNNAEKYQNVAKENLEKVRRSKTSIMGIGWPLKAIFGYVMLIPYLIFVYLGKILIDKLRKMKTVT
jgi:4-amino-4-deoxy-L-arabinose transferase-like glycosyltransferase